MLKGNSFEFRIAYNSLSCCKHESIPNSYHFRQIELITIKFCSNLNSTCFSRNVLTSSLNESFEMEVDNCTSQYEHANWFECNAVLVYVKWTCLRSTYKAEPSFENYRDGKIQEQYLILKPCNFSPRFTNGFESNEISVIHLPTLLLSLKMNISFTERILIYFYLLLLIFLHV